MLKRPPSLAWYTWSTGNWLLNLYMQKLVKQIYGIWQMYMINRGKNNLLVHVSVMPKPEKNWNDSLILWALQHALNLQVGWPFGYMCDAKMYEITLHCEIKTWKSIAFLIPPKVLFSTNMFLFLNCVDKVAFKISWLIRYLSNRI